VRLLLDTYAALWFLEGNERLSQTARALIEDDRIERRLSAAVVWEVAIKRGLGKLKVTADFHERMGRQGVSGLPVYDRHAARVADLPHHHSDPFDRLLVAQAIEEDMSILSADEILRKYDVDVIW
jgi:PIN domain nuclease of toxin-antitoxin system